MSDNVVDIRLLRLAHANRELGDIRLKRQLAEEAMRDALSAVAEYQAMEETLVSEIKRMEAGLFDGTNGV